MLLHFVLSTYSMLPKVASFQSLAWGRETLNLNFDKKFLKSYDTFYTLENIDVASWA